MVEEPQEILEEFKLTLDPEKRDSGHFFALGYYKESQITIYSQQVRALKLVWALNKLEILKDKKILVIGGGIAGVTAASAAALYGARVTILECREELLHLQRGCHTRYLHPRIYEWPGKSSSASNLLTENYRRADAGLPILNWSVGTASEVATHILADYHLIRLYVDRDLKGKSAEHRKALSRLKDFTLVSDIFISDDCKHISWRSQSDPIPEVIIPDVTILALGFGIENTTDKLPRRSYWRMDSLAQTALDSDDRPYKVLVAGAGDGGIIDMLRAKLKEFDHGGFFDDCVLRLQKVREKIGEVERELNKRKNELVELNEKKNKLSHGRELSRAEQASRFAVEKELSIFLNQSYEGLGELKEIDEMFAVQRPNTHVIWIGMPPYPASSNSQPLNRLLGWYLCKKGHVEYIPGKVEHVEVLEQKPPGGFRYEVIVNSEDYEEGKIWRNQLKNRSELTEQNFVSRRQWPARVHQVVLRTGTSSEYDRSPFKDLGKPKHKPFSLLSQCIVKEYECLYECVQSSREKWREDICICASPDSKPFPVDEGKATAYRISIWLKQSGALDHLSLVEYDLHPEFGSIHRRAIRTADSNNDNKFYRHWVVTRRDYWIRVRCSDGSELGEWLSKAIDNNIIKNNIEGADKLEAEMCRDELRKGEVKTRPEEYWTKPWCEYIKRPERPVEPGLENGS